jgi:hypothetical protein
MSTSVQRRLRRFLAGQHEASWNEQGDRENDSSYPIHWRTLPAADYTLLTLPILYPLGTGFRLKTGKFCDGTGAQ